MKLRNKKTGEVVVGINKIGLVWNKYGMPAEIGQYDSIAELNEEWEDYTPTEPLIKDGKIRKAVRAWAEAIGREKLLVIKLGGRLEISDGSPHLIYISFHADKETLNGLDDRTYYTIDELCGEEEAPEPIEPTFVDLDERIKEKEEEWSQFSNWSKSTSLTREEEE